MVEKSASQSLVSETANDRFPPLAKAIYGSTCAAYKMPRDVQFVADLPKTSTGKIMRRELKTLDSLENSSSV